MNYNEKSQLIRTGLYVHKLPVESSERSMINICVILPSSSLYPTFCSSSLLRSVNLHLTTLFYDNHSADVS